MRLSPIQRIHAVCAFVVPIVLVLLFAPERAAAPASPAIESCVAESGPPACVLAEVTEGSARD